MQCCQLTACCCAELVCCHGSSQSQRRIHSSSPPIGWQSSPVSRDWNAAFLSFRFARQSLVLKVNLLSVSILDGTLPEQITDEKMSWNCQVITQHYNKTAIQLYYISFFAHNSSCCCIKKQNRSASFILTKKWVTLSKRTLAWRQMFVDCRGGCCYSIGCPLPASEFL